MSSCQKCDELEVVVSTAERAVNHAIKNQGSMTYAEVRQLQRTDHPLRKALGSALRKRSIHVNKHHR